jgi:hypothetical protein
MLKEIVGYELDRVGGSILSNGYLMQLLLPFLGDLRKGLKKDGHDSLIEVCTNRQLLERIIFLL